jgi:pyoverdine/dityrosine biosynthesis protein Dit1
MAEEQALLFIANVCREIQAVYPPGVRLTICSDGHVFSDLVGVPDDDVSAYGSALSEMIDRLGLNDIIDTFSLGDLYDSIGIPEMREGLNRDYEQSIASLKEKASSVKQTGRLIDGIHRFLFEDMLELDPSTSRTKVRNYCRGLAYQVVQRSDGWGRLLYDCFPMALRLSIHPQEPHSDKIGMLLGRSDDVWLTPWHAVAVKTEGSFTLMKRHEAEASGAKLHEGARYYER